MRFISLFKKKYQPLNILTIVKEALFHNYTYLSKSSGLAIAPVLKSNAYGHGLVLTAKTLDPLKAPFFCVDSIYEAYELHKNHIKTPILIMGYVSQENLKLKKMQFSFAVSTRDSLEAVHTYQPQAGIHIFVDTGMHREGFPMQDFHELIRFIKAKQIKIEGLMSHFGASDRNDSLTKEQVKNFQKAQALFLAADIKPQWMHITNSSGVLNHKNYKGKIGNLGRAGIALYGIDPEQKNKNLQPAISFYSTLAQIKDLKKGESSGYDFTFTAKKDMKIGVISSGYNDGVDRRLSNIGVTKIGNTYCPIIGKVSMNITMIDISAVKNPKVGMRVEIYSNNSNDKNSLYHAAALCGDISYDFLVKLAASTKRIVV